MTGTLFGNRGHASSQRLQPDYLGFVFDAGRDKFRHRLCEPYKATREKLDETDASEFRIAMERLQVILGAFRIPAIEVEGFEADDVISALAVQGDIGMGESWYDAKPGRKREG